MITTTAATPLTYQVPFRCETASADQLEIKIQRAITQAALQYRGAIFTGPTGTGKTFAMIAAMREPLQKAFEDRPMFVDWPEFIGDVDRWKSQRTDDRDRFDPMRRLCGWRGPLFVDDVGQEQHVDSGYRLGESESLFDQFINRRTGLDVPLWITTNLTSSEIRTRYGERTVSRLSQHCLYIRLGDTDRRLAAV